MKAAVRCFCWGRKRIYALLLRRHSQVRDRRCAGLFGRLQGWQAGSLPPSAKGRWLATWNPGGGDGPDAKLNWWAELFRTMPRASFGLILCDAYDTCNCASIVVPRVQLGAGSPHGVGGSSSLFRGAWTCSKGCYT